jgi:dihydropteroate synthase
LKIVKINHSNEAVELFQKIGVDPYGIEAMAPKVSALNILIPALPCKVANILKQEMLSLGADAAVARGSVACSIDKTDVLIMGTQKQIKALTGKIDRQPFGLHEIAQDIRDLIIDITQDCYTWKTSRRQISLGRKTLVMGILNVTPDSFSDGKLYFDRQRAIDHGLKMVDEGADLLDIGGESTRPGSKPVTARQEIARVIPVLEGLSGKIKIPISIDTTKAHVAQAALAAGAEIVNDISALGDKKMVAFIKQSGAALILMHMKGKPENMQTENPVYDDVMGVIISYLKEKTQKATKAGIAKDHLVLDPGIGFGKSYQDNCKIIRKLDELKGLGMPVLIGTSRKSFIGQVTGGKPEERIEGTAATVAAAIINGCHIVRVHDVAYMKKVAAMTDAIIHA